MAMKLFIFIAAWLAVCLVPLYAQVPENLVADGLPPVTPELRLQAGPYLQFRAALLSDWHPLKKEMLVLRRATDSVQLFSVTSPGRAPIQLTTFSDPVSGGLFHPQHGKFLVFAQDKGGNEFFQLYRYDLDDKKVTLLTDGKSRNIGSRWSTSGKWFAYTSTRRNGTDTDIYLVDPSHPESDHLFKQVNGSGWRVADWSRDDKQLLLHEYISINESYLYLVDVQSSAMQLLTPKTSAKASYVGARFSRDGKSVFTTTDRESEFLRLLKMNLDSKKETLLTGHIPWDVDDFELSPDGTTLAFVSNEDGIGVLHLLDTRTEKEVAAPRLPLGVVSALKWHANSRDLAFNMTSARSPNDVFSLDIKTGEVTRWTESETGVDAQTLVEPRLEKMKSFDGLEISAFVYRPDPKRFPGPRPALVFIHGGPESQSRPGFMARFNFVLNEMGVGIVLPNVRGSAGRGKTFLELDNGFKREDSVKDIGTVLDWIAGDAGFDRQRIAVYGGSYGGYMVLACMTHFSDRLRCGVDVVGISNFLTFLKNTQDYRRDLRRAEYGDERDAKMREFLEKISPIHSVQKIKKPLFVVQGKNDPRVPVTESEQMVKAIRDQGGKVWYLMAKDEGHGFQKKGNADFQFLAMILFLREHLTN
jgi:dipeptidyl aminopeptidase/acylaminoacyl peptidase